MDANSNENIGKREQILEAAIKIFAYKGFYNAKVEEIAIEAKVGKGTVYEYFKSKQDLFQEMVKYIHDLYFNVFVADATSKTTFREKISYLLHAHLKFAIEHREMAQLFVSEHPPIDGDFKKWFISKEKEKMFFLQNSLVEGINRKEIRDIDPYLLTKVVAGVMVYIGNSIVFNEIPMTNKDISSLSGDVVELLYTGIGR